ncbi:MAG: hypothetical protein SGJ18_14270 [Pseudomonadota bacterium]|nr:hypothetical protein [Pseudomonadota bacterium]
MKHCLALLSLLFSNGPAQAKRTFEEKKFLLQSTTVVSSLIYSGKVIAEATLASGTDCVVGTNSVENHENPPRYETTLKINGQICSIYFYEHIIGDTEQGAGKAEVLLTTGLNVRPRAPTTVSTTGDFRFLDNRIVRFRGNGIYKDGSKVATVSKTVSEIIFFEGSPRKVSDLKFTASVNVGDDYAEVVLKSHKNPDGKTETHAKIDDIVIPQSDLETMFPNTYKKPFKLGEKNENRFYDFTFNE